MQILLSEDQTLIRDSAQRFGEGHGGGDRLRRLRDGPSGLEPNDLADAGADGWLGLMAPEDAGGAGLGTKELCLVAEQAGRALATLPLVPAAAGVQALSEGGAGFADLLARAIAGEALVVPALQTDSRDGGEYPIETSASDGGGLRLTGHLAAVPAAGAADAFIIDAGTGGTRVMVLVHKDAPGIAVKTQRAIDGSPVGCVDLKDTEIADADVLARGDDAVLLRRRLDTVILLGHSAEMIGIMDAAQEMTLEYLRTRDQFGGKLSAFQALQHRAVDNFMAVESARALVFEAAGFCDRDDPYADWLASAAKAKTGPAAIQVCNSCIQLHGAIGFTDEHDIGLYLKRAMAVAALNGPPAAHLKRYAEYALAPRNDADIPSFRVDTEAEAAFRRGVRGWLEGALPERLRNLPTRPNAEESMWWHKQLFAQGWIAPAWPKEWQGMDANLSEQIILADEMARIGAPEISAQAIGHLGPILLRYGTDEQKKRHMPGMVAGDVLWCQGYSEPGAGSDLASLRTSGVVDGDHLVINGQKIWTTWGHLADWIFALVRTDPDAPRKQEGISFILIDMKTPGITARGIQTLPDEDEFAEVFFDDVRVPLANIVGGMHEGWGVATALLANERGGSANPKNNVQALRRINEKARANGAIEDAGFRDRLMQAELEVLAISAGFAQVVVTYQAGRELGPDSSYLKLLGTESEQLLADLMIEAYGSDGALLLPHKPEDGSFDAASNFLRARRATIAGGTSGIQCNIIARRVLDLK
ncbi:MAG: acyl-CoA dehydrogenase family protein [Rhodospirillales bacterium]